jgi:farnesyl-diphosphate farnesyltransferase
MAKSDKSNDSFIQEYIPKVSRTFALTIKFLPRGLRNSVYTSYLLCRVADTLEDTACLPVSEKSGRLLTLRDILLDASKGKTIDMDNISAIYDSVNPSGSDDHKLLSESTRLFEILDSLPASHKRIIFKWVAEMAEGMAEYSRLNGEKGNSIATLRDLEDWDRYCYYVAGTVGHMLTELFIKHYNFAKEISKGLKKLSNSFGLGLQKINVIKDVPGDRERGVCYLPGDVLKKYGLDGSLLKDKTRAAQISDFVREMVGLTVPHLDDAMEYSTYIPAHLKGVRMFLIVPVYLAIETLALVKSNPVRAMSGPPVKLNRMNVTGLVGAATLRIGSNKKLMEYYLSLRNKI